MHRANYFHNSFHSGPFLLTELLLPLIEKSEEGRIVNVSAKLHEHVRNFENFTRIRQFGIFTDRIREFFFQEGPLNLETIDDKKSFGRLAAYNRSKLANVSLFLAYYGKNNL